MVSPGRQAGRFAFHSEAHLTEASPLAGAGQPRAADGRVVAALGHQPPRAAGEVPAEHADDALPAGNVSRTGTVRAGRPPPGRRRLRDPEVERHAAARAPAPLGASPTARWPATCRRSTTSPSSATSSWSATPTRPSPVPWRSSAWTTMHQAGRSSPASTPTTSPPIAPPAVTSTRTTSTAGRRASARCRGACTSTWRSAATRATRAPGGTASAGSSRCRRPTPAWRGWHEVVERIHRHRVARQPVGGLRLRRRAGPDARVRAGADLPARRRAVGVRHRRADAGRGAVRVDPAADGDRRLDVAVHHRRDRAARVGADRPHHLHVRDDRGDRPAWSSASCCAG